jgi:hypothetical protein
MKMSRVSWSRSHHVIVAICLLASILFLPYAYNSASDALAGAWATRFRILITLLMTAGASFICAALLGFVFAVGHEPTDNGRMPSRPVYGSNLTQLSNWLTALVVGVSLVSFEEISVGLRGLSVDLARTGTGFGNEWPLILSVILFYAACGFLSGVLFTLLEFPTLLHGKESLELQPGIDQ